MKNSNIHNNRCNCEHCKDKNYVTREKYDELKEKYVKNLQSFNSLYDYIQGVKNDLCKLCEENTNNPITRSVFNLHNKMYEVAMGVRSRINYFYLENIGKSED